MLEHYQRELFLGMMAAAGVVAAVVFVQVMEHAREVASRRAWRELVVMALATLVGALGVVAALSAAGVIEIGA